MVKLTPDLIDNASQFINACSDRELDLRDYKIPVLENLGATHNQFDVFDLSNNDIKKMDNIPLLNRLKVLVLHNNRVSFFQSNIGSMLPRLHTLMLTNNNLQELGDLDPLEGLPKLEYLSLIGNPVTKKPKYRLYVVYKLPHIRVLDFRRVKLSEREEATAAFKGKKGEKLRREVVKKSQEETSVEKPAMVNGEEEPTDKRPEEVKRIKEAIAAAKTLQEVDHLQQILALGQIPAGSEQQINSVEKKRTEPAGMEEEEVEEEEEDMDVEQA